jgi:Uma2 family endonuclease
MHSAARAPRAFNLVWDPAAEGLSRDIDWSHWYLLEEDDVGQSPEQDEAAEVFSASLRQLAMGAGWRARVGKDAFFAWIPSEPNVRVSPDVYVLDDPPEPPWPKTWQTWLRANRPPRFALEIVSEEWRKDYHDNPPKYAMLGALELVIFDPEATRDPTLLLEGAKLRKAAASGADTTRYPLQVFVRAEDGAFLRVYRGAGPAFAETIGAWLLPRVESGVGLLRLSRDREGNSLIPTGDERAEQEAARAEQEAARAEQEAARAERLARKLAELGIDPQTL